ncbi:MAG: hypothetical protein EOP06_05245 [Proteobacteria bacterium]|nr:MAG: hypothetical protein EOP06_05245 [Pseudomonadota bacterium]
MPNRTVFYVVTVYKIDPERLDYEVSPSYPKAYPPKGLLFERLSEALVEISSIKEAGESQSREDSRNIALKLIRDLKLLTEEKPFEEAHVAAYCGRFDEAVNFIIGGQSDWTEDGRYNIACITHNKGGPSVSNPPEVTESSCFRADFLDDSVVYQQIPIPRILISAGLIKEQH